MTRIHCIIGAFAVLLFAAGCGNEEVVAENEESAPAPSETAGATTADDVSPEVLIAAYRGSAEALGFRDESDPNARVFLYFDESTELLYRLSFHGIDPAFLPEVGPILKEPTEDGDVRIESTLHKDSVIWIEAVCVIPGDQADQQGVIEDRIRQVQESFAKRLHAEQER